MERELGDLCAEIGAVPVEVLSARFSFVVVARTPRRDIVIRVTADPNGKEQAKAAELLAACGAGPRIHEVRVTVTGAWTIAERVVPGLGLDQAGPGAVSLDALAAPFRAIAETGAVVAGELPPIHEWLRFRLERDDPRISTNERKRGLAVLTELAPEAGLASLCHGDANPGNVLVTSDSRALLIDPRGMYGEVAYDVAVLSLQLSAFDPEAARGPCLEIAARAGADGERAVAWMTVALAARV